MMAPRALTITLEAKSNEHLRKLLELALFDLDKVRENAWPLPPGSSVPASMTGDMGSYQLEYKVGTHALIAEHQRLLEEGYTLIGETEWEARNYSVYDHPEKHPIRLYHLSAEAVEHDVQEHKGKI